MSDEHCKVLVIGGGPGGYVCAIRGGQLGLDVVLIEEDALGGTCLNVGCIPSKALIHASDELHRITQVSEGPLGIVAGGVSIEFGRTMAWKDDIVRKLTTGVAGLLRKARVRVVKERARILDGKTVQVGERRITTENLVIATGSRALQLPFLPFGGPVISSTEALSLPAVPETLAVIGGGYIGLELGTAMAKFGSKVTIIEAAARILPQYDADLTRPVAARLRALGAEVMTNAKALRATDRVLSVETDGREVEIPCEKVLVAVGRVPVTSGFGLEGLGLTMNGGFLAVDRNCRTSMRGVYAIGDVTGDPMLAHRAMAQGALVADTIAGLPVVWDKRAIPAICFTDPEIVTVGELPEQSERAAVAIFPFVGNGRSVTLEQADGFVRIVHEKDSGLVLGIQAVGGTVSELAGEFGLAIEMAATLADIAETIHAHPTLGEVVQEAALKGLGRAPHI
jgi:dihydrolipoamide dehydrogenase